MNARSRFLEGAFAPVAEEITAFDLPVTGRVPAELSGRYLRNGPNPLGLNDPNYHWFLGPELHAIAYFWAWDHVQHIVIDSTGRVSHTTDIPVADGPMMHDFALTGNYVVLFDLPVTFSLDLVSAGREMPYTWNPAHQARIGLLRRDRGGDGQVRWIEVDPCWIFHTLNAYDDGDRVVVDLVRYEGSYDVSVFEGRGPVTLDRWAIDPAAGKVAQFRLDDRHQEFPRVDDRMTGRPHRYGTTPAAVPPTW